MTTLIVVLFVVAMGCFMATTVPLVQTKPKQAWYFEALDYALWPIMWLGFRKKLTHAYHWSTYYNMIDLNQCALAKGDPNTARGLEPLSQMWAECALNPRGWKQVAVIGLPTWVTCEHWQVGFRDTFKPKQKLCTILLNPKSDPKVRLYVGRIDVEFFGLNEKGEQIPINLVTQIAHNHHLWRKFKLL